MKQIDTAVKRETIYIAISELIFSLLMESVFLIVGKWNISVFYGNLLSASASVLNFFLMGITVQKALDKDEKQRVTVVKLSQSLRMLFIFAVATLGLLLPCFHIISVLVPLFFPRIAVMFRPVFNRLPDKKAAKDD